MKKILFFLVIYSLSFQSVIAQCVDQANVYNFSHDSKNYQVIKEAKTWVEAAACAVELGGTLARIDSQEEQDALWDELTNNAGINLASTVASNGGGASYVWIGGSDIVEEETWIWDGDNNGLGVLRCTSNDGVEDCGRMFLDFDMDFSIELTADQTSICSVSSSGSEVSFERVAWGQSFSTSCSGNINTVTFSSASALNESLTFSIFDGIDCNSSVLFSQTLTEVVLGENTVTIDNDLTLNENNTYFFQIESDNDTPWRVHYSNVDNVFGLLVCTSNDGLDPCGRSFPSFDLNFSVELVEPPILAQETISSGRISITFDQAATGIHISSISDNGVELLNNEALDWFTLNISNITNATAEVMTSCCDWNSVELNNNGGDIELILSDPNNANLPSSLTATITVITNDDKSTWDMAVSGLGADCSLINVDFPKINIKADGNDTFFYPLYSGKLTPNPANGIDFYDDIDDPSDGGAGLYPRGWGTTMQYMSYYNNTYGMYFGFHDAGAAMKQFQVRDFDGGVELSCKNPAPDETIAGNDWQMPGAFQLDLYNGDWYDAALKYKEWVSSSADYWPTPSTARNTRQHEVGDIGAWITTYVSEASIPNGQTNIQTAIDFYDFPVGVHLYEWNDYEVDHNYPVYYPETDGFDNLVQTIQTNNDDIIMPYFNGRMWDVGTGTGNDADDAAVAAHFLANGFADAVKNSDGTYTADSPFEGNNFAVMCPSQSDWQDILVDVVDEATRLDRLGSEAVYIDMVAASGPKRCMDPSHGHPLGGGTLWRDGYKEMFTNIHNTIPTDRFLTVEGGCDYLVDEVDAFMVQGWTAEHQVPAWGAIYTGQVQMFGTKTGGGEYGSQLFYSKLAQGFSFGVQTGRQFIWLSIWPEATPVKAMASSYVRNLGRMRYKLRDFMSYGEMKRPIDITGAIPDMSYEIFDWGGERSAVNIVEPAIQKSVWQSGNRVVVVFVNAEMPNVPNGVGTDINFSFNFVGSDYGLGGDLTIQEITPTTDGAITPIGNSFTQDVTLSSLQQVAYIISSEPVGQDFALKAFLEGPYDETTGLMSNNLNTLGEIPLEEPFTTLGFTQVIGGGETTTQTVLDIVGDDAIVDWVLVELRSTTDASVIIATHAALLQRDGDVVDVDGTSSVNFHNISEDNFFVSLRHRNHFGVRALDAYSINNPVVIDFTNATTAVFGFDPMSEVGGVSVLIAGDANGDGQINAVDKNNFWRVENGEPFDYINTKSDFNLDGISNPVDMNGYWRVNNSKMEQLD